MSDLWATPQALFEKLDAEFNFELDVCAIPENKKCDRFFSPEQNGLTQEWSTPKKCLYAIWMNPPYGLEIERWMKKAYETSLRGYTVVALIPNRSNAPWWHDYVMKASEIRFIKHKVSFEGEAEGVPFWGSVIVVFDHCGFSTPRVSTYFQPRHDKAAA